MKAFLTETWDTYLKHFVSVQKDIYFEEKYVKLYETDCEKALCFVCSYKDKYFIYPFLRREFIYQDVKYYDFETSYGYGGPITNTEDVLFNEAALKEFYKFCKNNNYIAGFTRFHPLLNNCNSFEIIGKLIKDRETIAIDIRSDIEDVWMKEIHTKNRNVIKRGYKNNLKFIADYDFIYLNDFLELYNKTMRKLEADNFYYFDNKYYDSFKNNLKNSFLGVVLLDDKVIASAIFFYSENYGHYHLAGSDLDYLKFSPNNFLLWNAAKELKSKNIKYFHLGGGINSDNNNSLFKFKSRFSKSKYDFYIGKLIFNEDIYESLCSNWERKHSEIAEKYKYHLLKYKY